MCDRSIRTIRLIQTTVSRRVSGGAGARRSQEEGEEEDGVGREGGPGQGVADPGRRTGRKRCESAIILAL